MLMLLLLLWQLDNQWMCPPLPASVKRMRLSAQFVFYHYIVLSERLDTTDRPFNLTPRLAIQANNLASLSMLLKGLISRAVNNSFTSLSCRFDSDSTEGGCWILALNEGDISADVVVVVSRRGGAFRSLVWESYWGKKSDEEVELEEILGAVLYSVQVHPFGAKKNKFKPSAKSANKDVARIELNPFLESVNELMS